MQAFEEYVAPPLTVAVLDNGSSDHQRTAALRMARSVRPDGRHTWVGPRFGWRPADLAAAPWNLSTIYDDGNWRQVVAIDDRGSRTFTLLFGLGVHQGLLNRDAAESVQVRGAAGWQVPENRQVFLTLPDGVEVFLQLTPRRSGQPTDDPAVEIADLLRIAEGFQFGPWPDMSWVGTR